MSNVNKKQSFLHGAAILALSTAIVKLIGALYKLPLVRIIGNAGYSYFGIAYDIYSVLLTVSAAGLPVAMSRMISEAQTLDNNAQIRRVYQASVRVFLILGIVGTSIMLFFAKQLSHLMNSPNSWIAMATLSPAVLFICMISSYRGFFQGQSNMTPTAVSQVIEAICKLFPGLLLAYWFAKAGADASVSAAGAIVGVTLGTVIAMMYLAVEHRRAVSRLKDADTGGQPKSMRATMYQLLAIAIPITIGSAGLQIINVIDSGVVLGRLVNAVGYTQDAADNLKGIYVAEQTLFNLPSAFIVPLTVSIIPSITEQLTRHNHAGALRLEESSIRIMALLALPCGVGLAVLSGPIQEMLYGYTGDSLAVGTPLLAILGLAVIFNCLVLLTNAIMQAHGWVSTPVFTMLIGGVVKVIIDYILVSIPSLNIVGAPIATLCCYIIITVLNLLAMHRLMRRRPRILLLMVKPVLATAAMAIAAYISYDVLFSLLRHVSIAVLGAIMVAVIIYFIFVVVLRVVTKEDCMLLPKGEKIAKLLKIQ